MSSSILIENLSLKTDVSSLCEMFGKYGRILSANIETGSNLESLCKGHVLYDTFHSAHYAVKEMNGKKHFGRQVYVKHEKSISSPSDSTQSEYFKKIFVKNIDSTWDDYNLIGEFERFGEIEDAKVFLSDGLSNGYGFVRFQKHTSAKMAVEAMHGKVINDKKLVVKPFTYKDNSKTTTTHSNNNIQDKPIQPNNLFIKNLPKDMDEYELRGLFEKCGSILSVRIATDNSQNSKGYGFVCFHDKMVAAKARNQMNGLSYRSKILEVDFYKKKSNNYADSKVKGTEKQTYMFFPPDKKTVFSFSGRG